MPSRTGFGGNNPLVSPEMNGLSERGWHFPNTFTMGNPTEFALPGLFASSYLLDDGGYRHGIADRNVTFAETLKEKGYATSAFFSIFRPFNDQYHRGFDSFYHLYDLQVTEKNFLNTANWYSSEFNKGNFTLKESTTELFDYYHEYLHDVIRYCETWISYADDDVLPESKILDAIDHARVATKVEEEIKVLEESPESTLAPFFQGGDLAFSKIVKEEFARRRKKAKTTFLDLRFRSQILRRIPQIFKYSASYQSAKATAALAVDRVLHGQQNLLMRYPSGGYILESFKRWHQKHNATQPFYSYLKLLDAHEFNLYSHDLSEAKEEQEKEYQVFRKCISSLIRKSDYKGNMLYDCAIRYVDEVLSRLLAYLRQRKILDNTILVITADHGGIYPDIPHRDKASHRLNTFYDEIYHIPLIILADDRRDLGSENLISSVDIASTLLDMIGEKIPDSFRGESLLRANAGRPYVMAENQGRGPCDLVRKPIRVCVRSKRFKLIYEAHPTNPDNGFVDQLYDLTEDPEEYKNIKDQHDSDPKIAKLMEVAKNRIKDILN